MTEEHAISLQPGTVIDGKYEVVKCLGAGSMGLVYACRNRILGQIVAVKVLFPEVASDKVASARFKNEILASYEVSHPNVVRAYDYINERDLVAYSMEYVGGGDLAAKLGAEERMSIPEIVRMLGQMAAGCQAIHDAGIVHRDLKPENILLTSEGNVKIADFGIARNRHGPKLTEHGGVVGTVEYVAPEYMLKSQVDWRSDIYALGILAYEMVVGESPFKGDSVYAAMTKRLKTDPENPSKLRPECPTELDRIILKAMQREPEKRYQAAREMLADLQKLGSQMGIVGSETGSFASPSQGTESMSRHVQPIESIKDLPPASAKPPSPRSPSSGRLRPESLQQVESRLEGGAAHASPWTASQQPLGHREPTSDDILGGTADGSSAKTGTEVIDDVVLDLVVEAGASVDSPYPAPEPLVTSVPNQVGRKHASSKSVGLRPSKGRSSRADMAYEEGRESRFAEILALCFAAVVGIGCGFMFLKFFAPSLLEKWHL